MTWQAIKNSPVLNARQRWEKQEHDRRVRLLGEWLAEDWAQVVSELALDDGHLSQDKVLQLMEDVYEMGQYMPLTKEQVARQQTEGSLRRQFDHFITHLSDEELAHLKEHFASVTRMLDAVLDAAMSNGKS